MSDHFIKRCRHGTMVTQCRCFDKNKRVVIVACPPHCPTKQAPTPDVVPTTKETDEYEWPLTGDRLHMWGQDN
jgi:hypothetical protein